MLFAATTEFSNVSIDTAIIAYQLREFLLLFFLLRFFQSIRKTNALLNHLIPYIYIYIHTSVERESTSSWIHRPKALTRAAVDSYVVYRRPSSYYYQSCHRLIIVAAAAVVNRSTFAWYWIF